MRSQLIALAKRFIWWGMRRPIGAKIATLVSEERTAFLYDQTHRQLGSEWAKSVGTTVREGPFTGLEYPALAAAGSAVFPKVIGSYESELHPALEEIITRSYRRIVNIGAAEGFYAVGLARRMPDVVVEAYEMNLSAHPLLRSMADLNGVSERVRLHGMCTVDSLKQLSLHNDLLVVDCEGAELDLLDPALVPGLETCDVLVELHTVKGRSTGDTLSARFGKTHRVKEIPVRPRNPDHYPALEALPEESRWAVLHERSSALGWAWIVSSKVPVAGAV